VSRTDSRKAPFEVDYTAYYRWQWFARAQWRNDFRRTKRASATAFAQLVKERGFSDKPVLDCTSGLGIKTIVIREAGLAVDGSDKCAFAVEHARLFAEEEGHGDLKFFEAAWQSLPKAAPTRYAAIFNDALSWIYSKREMAASLKGLHDALLPGGILVYMGALPGSRPQAKKLLADEWARTEAGSKGFALGWRHAEGGVSVSEIQAADRGRNYIDRRHLYVIEEEGKEPRLEFMTLRCVYKWDWRVIKPLLLRAGFRKFTTKEFPAADGRRAHLVVAERGQGRRPPAARGRAARHFPL